LYKIFLIFIYLWKKEIKDKRYQRGTFFLKKVGPSPLKSPDKPTKDWTRGGGEKKPMKSVPFFFFFPSPPSSFVCLFLMDFSLLPPSPPQKKRWGRICMDGG
jgi:hypothetical protein